MTAVHPEPEADALPPQKDCRNCGEFAQPNSDYCQDCYWGKRDNC